MVKFECPFCGYSMQSAQYLNGKGTCLKCTAVVAETEKHPLNPEWCKKMRTKFDALNSDGKVNKNGLGTLDYEEMCALLKKGNPNFTEEELKGLFDGADTNGNGVIEFSEFLWFIYGQPSKGGASAAARDAKATQMKVNHRAPGEAVTNKLAPSDACESDLGVCSKCPTPGGPHHFKFGACSYCHMGEGAYKKKLAAAGKA